MVPQDNNELECKARRMLRWNYLSTMWSLKPFLLQDPNLQGTVNLTSPVSGITRRCDCTSHTDTPTSVLITSSAASHLLHQTLILRQLNAFTYFWVQLSAHPLVQQWSPDPLQNTDLNSVWHVLTLRVPQEVPSTTGADKNPFSIKLVPKSLEKEKNKTGE